MDIVFRYTEGEAFYLLDRRQNTKKLDFWKRQGAGKISAVRKFWA